MKQLFPSLSTEEMKRKFSKQQANSPAERNLACVSYTDFYNLSGDTNANLWTQDYLANLFSSPISPVLRLVI